MALVTRISRLFKADMHAIIDSIEEPESLLRQAIREMEDLIIEDGYKLNTMSEHHKHVLHSIEEIKSLLAQDDEELDLCLEEDNEQLARVVIKRKLERSRYKAMLDAKQAKLSKSIVDMKKNISDNKMSLESMQQKSELFLDHAESVNDLQSGSYSDFNISQDDVEVALLREKRKRSLL